ncbi:MAG: hypothetical protein ACRDG3_01120 [Tepidiformaceae bacterium]
MLVLIPHSTVLPRPLPDGTDVVRYHTAVDAVVAIKAGDGPAVILSDGLLESADALAFAIKTSGRSAIEVRGERWDGETESPLSASCRGVIAGFGPAGVLVAIGVSL